MLPTELNPKTISDLLSTQLRNLPIPGEKRGGIKHELKKAS
ncbi:MAG TPA: hypothetical protein VJI68_00570 [Candidatus Nanoarchaeia archaeon]|nr:hypothetical protein [Candidatus Nanoarchaeia archaeon]